MLHQEAVPAATPDLIRKLQTDPEFDQFYLVGGTALSLQIGHRKSIDIDFFTRSTFDTKVLIEHLEEKFGFSLQFVHHNTVKGFIDEILEPLIIEGVRMLSKQDIAAFKVNAITVSGTRVKDFVDINFCDRVS